MTLRSITATAPSAWASYLINGDASGLEPSEREAADSFVRLWLGNVMPVSCESIGYHSRCNAAGSGLCGGAECERYTSLVEDTGHALAL